MRTLRFASPFVASRIGPWLSRVAVDRAVRRLPTCVTVAVLSAVAAAQDCPPIPQPGCFIFGSEVCSTFETATTTFMLSTEALLVPQGGCAIATSTGSVACGALLNAAARGHTEGPCGTGDCSELEADSDLDSNGGNLLQSPRSADVFAFASTGSSSASAEADGTVAPLSMTTHWENALSSSRSKSVYQYSSDLQVTETEGQAHGLATVGGAFSTQFEQGCTGFTVQLTIDVEKAENADCTQTPPPNGCHACEGGLFSIGFVGWTVDWQLSDVVVQGVIATRIMGDGTVEPVLLGVFDSPGIDPQVYGDTLFTSGTSTTSVQVPAGTHVNVHTKTDFFNAHDGDIDANGMVCGPDEVLMISLVGVVLGDAEYTPRADFDLDGMITEEDLAAFYLLFHPDFCACLREDVNGDCCVNVIDYLAVLAAWGPCPSQPSPCDADVDGDGMVGITDLLAVLAAWGQGNCPK